MYNIIKSVIKSGRYELRDMLSKIDTMWLQGKLAEDEKTELCELAREGATPEMGYPSLDVQVKNLKARIEDLAARVKALEKPADNPDEGTGEIPDTGEDKIPEEVPGEDSADTPEETPESPNNYPDWRQPTCAEDAYYRGMGMHYTDGFDYECIAPEGYGVTYPPDVLPGMWKRREE